VKPDGYDTLRDTKHFNADVNAAKSRIASEYLMDCQSTGSPMEACKTKAAAKLKDGMKSDRDLSDVIVQAQLDLLATSAECSDTNRVKCDTQPKTEISLLDLHQNEVGARKFAAAISSAASAQADCMAAGETDDNCAITAKDAFQKLSGVGNNPGLIKAIDTLAKAKESGVVTEIKKIKELTTVAVYSGQCISTVSENIKKKTFDNLKALSSGKVSKSKVYACEGKNGKCECIIFTKFSEDTSMEDIDGYAKNSQPTFTLSGRRRLTSVESSTTTSVAEIDPNQPVVLSTTDDSEDNRQYLNSAPSVSSASFALWLVIFSSCIYSWSTSI